MGYTHYWTIHRWDSESWQLVWPKLIADSRLIVEAADVPLSGPESNNDSVSAPVVDYSRGIWLNGVEEGEHEDFILDRDHRDAFCKTAEKPYDVVVACILLRAYTLAPNNASVFSDGGWEDISWLQPKRLYRSLWPDDNISCPWEERDTKELDVIVRTPSEVETVTKALSKVIFEPSATLSDDYNSHEQAERPSETGSKAPALRMTSSQPLVNTENTTPATELQLIGTYGANFKPVFMSSDDQFSQKKSKQFTDTEMKLSMSSELTGMEKTAFYVKAWINACNSRHERCRVSPLIWVDVPDIYFKLIDVENKCVVRAPPGVSYIALSYVWGGVEQITLTDKGGLPLLEQNSLLDSRVPKTVSDAIGLCKQLGERYLWVDALCIVQDRVSDVKIQLLRMRKIYSSAKLTIVAAAGTDASAGLHWSQPTICSVAALDQKMEQLPWSTRAWCFQEKVLSHRLLLFTGAGIYMQCPHSTFNSDGEMLTSEEGVFRVNNVGSLAMIPQDQQLHCYLEAVSTYACRKLTKQADRIDAFRGVLEAFGNVMDGGKGTFWYGMPTYGFDQVFNWRAKSHNMSQRNHHFPSWSWLGWNTDVIFDHHLISWARTNQMVNPVSWPVPDGYPWKAVAEPFTFAAETMNKSNKNVWFFPTATSSYGLSESMALNAWATKVRIDNSPAETGDQMNRYFIYSTKCSQQRRTRPPKKISLAKLLTQPLPALVTLKDPNAPAIPLLEEDNASHLHHKECEAADPIGSIWLDSQWRQNAPKNLCLLSFPIAGRRNQKMKWRVTAVICVQELTKEGHRYGYERVQIMDCSMSPKEWRRYGSQRQRVHMV